jgi:hypothetical protein
VSETHSTKCGSEQLDIEDLTSLLCARVWLKERESGKKSQKREKERRKMRGDAVECSMKER